MTPSRSASRLRLGQLVPHPTVGATKGTDSILELNSARGGGRADQWHTDVTFVDAYPKISVLRGVVIPPLGGDTVWSNTAAAYLDLPPPLQRLADELWAVHSNAYDYAVKPRATEAGPEAFRRGLHRRRSTRPSTRWCVSIPETGERTLVLGNFVQRFVGLPKYDGQKLFDLFQVHVTAPRTPCDGAGRRATSRSGTIAPPSITPSTTTAIAARRPPRHARWRCPGQRRRPPQCNARQGDQAAERQSGLIQSSSDHNLSHPAWGAEATMVASSTRKAVPSRNPVSFCAR